MHDFGITRTPADEAARLSGFRYDHIATAQAFVESEELGCFVGFVRYYRKDG